MYNLNVIADPKSNDLIEFQIYNVRRYLLLLKYTLT